jgi:hypothetical protein
MKRFVFALAAVGFLAMACEPAGPASPSNASSSALKPLFGAGNNGNGIVGRVSVGGPDADFFFPDDKNFSMIALLRADGTADGQWVDMFGGPNQAGIHVDVDCVRIFGNDSANVTGIIKHGTDGAGVDVSGQRAFTRVWDRGTSANDPPDAISFSFFSPFFGPEICNFAGGVPALTMTRGQVKIN